MFVVMGATGNVGRAVLSALERRNLACRALSRRSLDTRHPTIEWLEVDALNTRALADAFTGAKGVFVLNPANPDAENVFHESEKLSKCVAEAICDARVPHVVALSSEGAHLASGVGIVATLNTFERELRKTDARLAILRSAYFMESWLPYAGEAIASGNLPAMISPASLEIECVATNDVGEAVVDCLVGIKTGIYNIVGPRRYSEQMVRDLIASKVGRPVMIHELAEHEIGPFHQQMGIGTSFATELQAMYSAINRGQIPFDPEIGTFIRGNSSLSDVLTSRLNLSH
ncbi:MAG: NAD(P)H-binding protein [Rhizobium sp.]|nr:NAD(P)H-binding protein [Rhizobium sp.]